MQSRFNRLRFVCLTKKQTKLREKKQHLTLSPLLPIISFINLVFMYWKPYATQPN